MTTDALDHTVSIVFSCPSSAIFSLETIFSISSFGGITSQSSLEPAELRIVQGMAGRGRVTNQPRGCRQVHLGRFRRVHRRRVEGTPCPAAHPPARSPPVSSPSLPISSPALDEPPIRPLLSLSDTAHALVKPPPLAPGVPVCAGELDGDRAGRVPADLGRRGAG